MTDLQVVLEGSEEGEGLQQRRPVRAPRGRQQRAARLVRQPELLLLVLRLVLLKLCRDVTSLQISRSREHRNQVA